MSFALKKRALALLVWSAIWFPGIALGANTASTISASTCFDDVADADVLSFDQLKEIFSLGEAEFRQKIATLHQFNDSLLHLSRTEWLDLVEAHPHTVVVLLQQTFGGTEVKLPTVIDLKDTWSLFLIQESLKHAEQKKVSDYLRALQRVAIFGEPLQPAEQILYDSDLIADYHPAIHWEEIFDGIGRLRGLDTVRPVSEPSKWPVNANRRGKLWSLYGAFCESWHRGQSPANSYLPGPAVKVSRRHHADVWRVEWQEAPAGQHPKMLVKGFTEIKASIIGYHEKGRYQIYSYLRRMMDEKAAIEIYGQKVSRDDILIDTKKGALTLAQLKAQFWQNEFFGNPGDSPQNIELGDERWPKFVKWYQEFFGDDFYEVILPKDHAPLVATVLRNADTNVAKITAGLLTVDEAREKFSQFVQAHLAPAGITAEEIRNGVFGTETAEISDLLRLGPRVRSRSSPQGEQRVAFSWSPGLTHPQRLEIAFREAVETNAEYAKLLQPGQTREREFIQKSLLPNIGMRLLYQAPGKLRPVQIGPGLIHFPKTADARALTICWSTEVTELQWSYVDDHFKLTIPAQMDLTADADTDRMLNHDLRGHELQRYNSTPEIQAARHALGEPKLFVKPGQNYALGQYRQQKAALAPGQQHRMFVLGPTAFGKSFILIEMMRDRMRDAIAQKGPRNIFFAVTQQKHIATQIGEEIGKSNELGMSEAVNHRHIAWETDQGRKDYSLEKLLDEAQANPDTPFVVTVNWDFFDSQMGKANGNGQKLLKRLKPRLNGLYIDEADQCKDQKHRQSVQLVAKDNPDIAILGIDAVSLDSDVIDGVFGSNLVSVYGDRMAPGIDRASIAFQQMQIAAYLGEITPPVDFRHNHVITHVHPTELLKDVIASRKGLKDSVIFSEIKDEELREEVYTALFGFSRDFFIRNQGFIRVNSTEQANQLSQFLQKRSDELGLGIKFAALHHKTKDFDKKYEQWKDPNHPEHIHWAVTVRLFDEAVNAPHMSGALILTDDMDPSVFLEVIGRPMRNYPGKRFAEVYQVSHKPIAREELQAALEQKEDWVKAQRIAAQQQVDLRLASGGGTRGPRTGATSTTATIAVDKLAAGDLETRARFTRQNLVPLFPTEAGELIDFNERREKLKSSVLRLRTAMMALQKLGRTPTRDELIAMDLELSDAREEAATTIYQTFGASVYVPIDISRWPYESLIYTRDISDADFLQQYKERLTEEAMGGQPQFLSNLPGNFLLERLLRWSQGYRRLCDASYPWSHEVVSERLKAGVTQKLWKETDLNLSTPDAVEKSFNQIVKRLAQETHILETEVARLKTLKYEEGAPLLMERLRPRMRTLFAAWNLLIPNDPLLTGLTADFLAQSTTTNADTIRGEWTMSELLEFLRGFPGIGPAMSIKPGAAVFVQLLVSSSREQILNSIRAYSTGVSWMGASANPRADMSYIAVMMTAPNPAAIFHSTVESYAREKGDPTILSGLNGLAFPVIHKYLTQKYMAKELGSVNALTYPAFVAKEISAIREFVENAANLRSDIDLASQMVPDGEIDFDYIFKGERPDMAEIALQHNNTIMIQFPITMVVTKDSIPNLRYLRAFQTISAIGPDNCDPNTPSTYENLWNLDFTNLNEDQRQNLIKQVFEQEFRQWYNGSVAILASSHITEDQSPIAWYNSFSWRAQQMILIQKSLPPEKRFMPLPEFSAIIVDALKAAAAMMKQEEAEIKINTVADLFTAGGRAKLNPHFLNTLPADKWNIDLESLVAVRNYLSRFRTRITDIHAIYKRKADSQTLWTEVLNLEKKTNTYLRHESTADPKFFEKEIARIATVLFQIDSELHRRDPQRYKKPTRPNK